MEWLGHNIGELVAVGVISLMSIIQVSKIEINPWTWVARKLGNAFNHDISEQIKNVEERANGRMDEFEKAIEEIKKQQDKDRAATNEYRAISSRVRILRFNEELLRKQKHSKESFDQALLDITDYRRYCDNNPAFQNERAVLAIQNIERCYQKCLEGSDFL
jgi:hypothetical protein